MIFNRPVPSQSSPGDSHVRINNPNDSHATKRIIGGGRNLLSGLLRSRTASGLADLRSPSHHSGAFNRRDLRKIKADIAAGRAVDQRQLKPASDYVSDNFTIDNEPYSGLAYSFDDNGQVLAQSKYDKGTLTKQVEWHESGDIKHYYQRSSNENITGYMTYDLSQQGVAKSIDIQYGDFRYQSRFNKIGRIEMMRLENPSKQNIDSNFIQKEFDVDIDSISNGLGGEKVGVSDKLSLVGQGITNQVLNSLVDQKGGLAMRQLRLTHVNVSPEALQDFTKSLELERLEVTDSDNHALMNLVHEYKNAHPNVKVRYDGRLVTNASSR